jgi:hypothetical protein
MGRRHVEVTGDQRRTHDGVVLPIYLADCRRTVQLGDGEMVGTGFTPFLDQAHTVEVREDHGAPVLPGVFYAAVTGVSFHDDVLQLPLFSAGSRVDIRPEPANAQDRTPLSVLSDSRRVGYVPTAIAAALAPSGTRSGHGIVLMEWAANGVRQGLWVLGSMHVDLRVSHEA